MTYGTLRVQRAVGRSDVCLQHVKPSQSLAVLQPRPGSVFPLSLPDTPSHSAFLLGAAVGHESPRSPGGGASVRPVPGARELWRPHGVWGSGREGTCFHFSGLSAGAFRVLSVARDSVLALEILWGWRGEKRGRVPCALASRAPSAWVRVSLPHRHQGRKAGQEEPRNGAPPQEPNLKQRWRGARAADTRANVGAERHLRVPQVVPRTLRLSPSPGLGTASQSGFQLLTAPCCRPGCVLRSPK